MALTEKSRIKRIILEFPLPGIFNARAVEAVDILNDGQFHGELREGQPVPLTEITEPEVLQSLQELIGEAAADLVVSAHTTAVAHEARLQEVADQRKRAEEAEALAADRAVELGDLQKMLEAAELQIGVLTQRAETAEGMVAAARRELTPAESAAQVQPQ